MKSIDVYIDEFVKGLSSHEESGLKSLVLSNHATTRLGLSSHEESGLKLHRCPQLLIRHSLSSHEESGLKSLQCLELSYTKSSLLTRGEWIEITASAIMSAYKLSLLT